MLKFVCDDNSTICMYQPNDQPVENSFVDPILVIYVFDVHVNKLVR